jgi:beta-phosphoglucomutase-like phosphatase (HAD superfamily)
MDGSEGEHEMDAMPCWAQPPAAGRAHRSSLENELDDMLSAEVSLPALSDAGRGHTPTRRTSAAAQRIGDSPTSKRLGTRLVVVLDLNRVLAPRKVDAFEESDDVRDDVLGGKVRFAKLLEFFLALARHNILLSLISASSDQLIRDVLAAAGLAHFFGLRVFGAREDAAAQAVCLRAELIEPLGASAQDVLFVSAQLDACEAVEAIGVCAVHVSADDGLGSSDAMDGIQKWVEARLLLQKAVAEREVAHNARVTSVRRGR